MTDRNNNGLNLLEKFEDRTSECVQVFELENEMTKEIVLKMEK